MNPAIVSDRVNEVSRLASEGDDEAAHVREDRLWKDVLEAIANDTADYPSMCAAIAVGTLDISFSRWFA